MTIKMQMKVDQVHSPPPTRFGRCRPIVDNELIPTGKSCRQYDGNHDLVTLNRSQRRALLSTKTKQRLRKSITKILNATNQSTDRSI